MLLCLVALENQQGLFEVSCRPIIILDNAVFRNNGSHLNMKVI